jgi:hypothetical protein
MVPGVDLIADMERFHALCTGWGVNPGSRTKTQRILLRDLRIGHRIAQREVRKAVGHPIR